MRQNTLNNKIQLLLEPLVYNSNLGNMLVMVSDSIWQSWLLPFGNVDSIVMRFSDAVDNKTLFTVNTVLLKLLMHSDM